jgi:hypothetical protein
MTTQPREQIKSEMRANAYRIRRGGDPVPLVLEPLVLRHDPLLDPPRTLLEQIEDQRVVADLVDGSETPDEYLAR